MTTYLTGLLIVTPLSVLWMWAVVKFGGVRFPPVDFILTVIVCNLIGPLPRVGWILATAVLVMVALRVEDAEPWPETVILGAGPMVMWFMAGIAVWSAIQS